MVCASRPVPPDSSPPSWASRGWQKCSTKQPKRCPGVPRRHGSSPAHDIQKFLESRQYIGSTQARVIPSARGISSHRRSLSWNDEIPRLRSERHASCDVHEPQAVGVASPEAFFTYVSNQATVSFQAASACSSFQRGLVSLWNACCVSE